MTMNIDPTEYGIHKYQNDNFRSGLATDLVAICNNESIDVYVQDFIDKDLSGLIEKDGEHWSIYVDEKDPLVRQRFTIAHELGHYFSYKSNKLSKAPLDATGELTDKVYLGRSITTDSNNQVEIEANAIAAELLMPKHIIDAMVQQGETIDHMAEKLGVSASALGFRLKNLGHTPLESI